VARFWLIRRILNLDATAIVDALRVAALAGLALLGASALVALIVGDRMAPLATLALQGAIGSVTYGGAVLGLDPRIRRRLWRAVGVRAVGTGHQEDHVSELAVEDLPAPPPVSPSVFDRLHPYAVGVSRDGGGDGDVDQAAGRRHHADGFIHRQQDATHAHRQQEAAS